MRLRHALNAAALACAAIASTTAHAELQTWHLTAQVYQVGPTPHAGFALWQTIGVDYTIDLDATDVFSPGIFQGAITSFTINGATSLIGGAGNLNAGGSGLNAINVEPAAVRADGIDFVSFNLFGGTVQPSVSAALNEFALINNHSTLWTDLRVDFGAAAGSIWARPVSFAIAVPEPETWGLALTGLLTMAFARRARNIRRARR